MTHQHTIRPRAGMKVPNPTTGKPLPPEGVRVRMSPYWRRRLRDGDVEVVEAPAPRPRKSTTKDGD